VWVLVLGFFIFLSDDSLRFSLVLDPRARQRGLGGKLGSAGEEFEDNEGGILGYGAHLPGLSQINVHLNSCCVVVVLWH